MYRKFEVWKDDPEYESPNKAPIPTQNSALNMSFTNTDQHESKITHHSHINLNISKPKSSQRTSQKDDLAYYKRSMEWLKRKNSKTRIKKQWQETSEVQGCSFAPKINNLSREISQNQSEQKGSFYQRNKDWQEKVNQKREVMKEEKEQKELQECIPERSISASRSNGRLRSSALWNRTKRGNHSFVHTNGNLNGKLGWGWWFRIRDYWCQDWEDEGQV